MIMSITGPREAHDYRVRNPLSAGFNNLIPPKKTPNPRAAAQDHSKIVSFRFFFPPRAARVYTASQMPSSGKYLSAASRIAVTLATLLQQRILGWIEPSGL